VDGVQHNSSREGGAMYTVILLYNPWDFFLWPHYSCITVRYSGTLSVMELVLRKWKLVLAVKLCHVAEVPGIENKSQQWWLY
jgi:hypothetical protein